MAGGLFDKAIATWEAIWGTDELRWELRCARSTIEARDAEIAALRQQLAERNGDTVRQQYGEVDAWREAAKDMVT